LRISVVIAVRNGARFIAAALDSVLAQTCAADEILVVDGGSRDDSAAIAGGYERVRVIEQDGAGFAGAWDEGIAAAGGDVLALLDSDDRWTPWKLACQAALLEAEPAKDYVVGRVQHFLEPGVEPHPSFRRSLLDERPIALMPGATLFRRAAFERVGPWATRYAVAADIDWFARAKDVLGPPARVDELVLYKRLHDANLSLYEAGSLNREILQLLRESVERRR